MLKQICGMYFQNDKIREKLFIQRESVESKFLFRSKNRCWWIVAQQ